MKLRRYIVATLAAAALAVSARADGFRYFVDMTASGYDGSETLVGFPLLVRVSPARVPGFNYSNVSAPGGVPAIRFYDMNGTLLPSECELWDTSGESVFWVRLPSLSGKNTKVRMCWGELAGEPVPDSRPTEVWTGFAGVWHMGETINGQAAAARTVARDSTANGIHAVPTNGVVNIGGNGTGGISRMVSVPGPIGNARINDNWSPSNSFGYNGNRFEVAANPALDVAPEFTFSCWIKFDDYSLTPQIVQRKKKAYSGSGWQVELDAAQSRNSFTLRGSGELGGSVQVSDTVLKDVGYQLYTFVYDNSGADVYVNGEYKGRSTISAPSNLSGAPLTFGNNADEEVINGRGTQSVQGKFDEVRLRAGKLQPDWIKAEFAQSDYGQADSSKWFLTCGELCNGLEAYWAVEPKFSPSSWAAGTAASVQIHGRAIVNGTEVTPSVSYFNLSNGEVTDTIPDERGLYYATFTVEGYEEALTRVVEVEVYRDAAYTLNKSDRVLLFNTYAMSDTSSEARMADQQQWATVNPNADVFWKRIDTPASTPDRSSYPNLQAYNMFEMWTKAYGAKLWTIDYCRMGNCYDNGGRMSTNKNYLPASPKSGSFNNPAQINAQLARSSALAMQNTSSAAIYSSCYGEGIGTIYFDAVNSVKATPNTLALEVCTKVLALVDDGAGHYKVSTDGEIEEGQAPTDEACQFIEDDGTTNRFARCVWEPVEAYRHVVIGNEIDEAKSGLVDSLALPLDCAEPGSAGTNENWFRFRTGALNIRQPARFRIRRVDGNPAAGDSATALDSATGVGKGLALIDNIICTPPAMSARVGQHGSYEGGEIGGEAQGGIALGQRGAFNVAFPTYYETNLYIRATTDYTGLTNSYAEVDVDADDGSGFVSSMTCAWRWRYLDQASSPWTTNFMYRAEGSGEWRSEAPLPLVDSDGNPVFGPGDIEYTFSATIAAPYAKFVDYTDTGVGVDGYTERIGKAVLEPEKTYGALVGRHDPHVPSSTYVRLREGASKYERIDLIVEDVSSHSRRTYPMELVSDHQWRGFLPTTNKVEQYVRFWFEGIHPQEDGAEYDDSPMNVVVFGCSDSFISVFPYNGSVGIGNNVYATLPVEPGLTGFISFSLNDTGLALAITHADRQTFDNWSTSRRNRADQFAQFLGHSGVTNATSNAGKRYPAVPSEKSVADFAVTQRIRPEWQENFKIGASQSRDGYPSGELFRNHATPKGYWMADFGEWAPQLYGDKTAHDFALLLTAKSFGRLTYAPEMSGDAPNGLDTFSFSARLAQRDSFDGVSYNLGAYRMANYTIAAQATFDSTSEKFEGFDGEASVSLIAGYRPHAGCYEFRVTVCDLGTGESDKKARFRYSLYRWQYDSASGDYVATTLTDTFGDDADGDSTGMNAAWRWNAASMNKETLCHAVPLGSCGGAYSGMFLSYSVIEGRVHLTAGVSSGSNHKENPRENFTYSGKQFCQIAAVDNYPVTQKGCYGFTSKNCPARMCHPRVYQGKTVEQQFEDGGELRSRWIGPVQLLANGDYSQERGGIYSSDPDWSVCQARAGTIPQTTSGPWGFQAVTNDSQAINMYVQKRAKDTNASIGDYIFVTNLVVSSFRNVPYQVSLRTPDNCNVRLTTGNGSSDVVIDNLEMSQWCGDNGVAAPNPKTEGNSFGNYLDFYYTSAWISNRVTVVNGRENTNRVAVLAPRRGINAKSPVGIRTPYLTGFGSITFSYVDAWPGAEVAVQRYAMNYTALSSHINDPENATGWENLTTFKIDEEDAREGSCTFFLGDRTSNGVFRIVIPQSTVANALEPENAGLDPNWMGLSITDVYCYDEPSIDERCWWGWNFLTTGWGDVNDAVGIGGASKANGLASILDGSRGAVCVLNDTLDQISLATDNPDDYRSNNPFIQSPTFPTNFIGDISFRARAYSAEGPSCVTVWGAPSASVQLGSDWLPITNILVDSTMYRRYSVKCTDEQRFCAIRVGVANVPGLQGPFIMQPADVDPVPDTVRRVIIDDVVVSERGQPDIGFLLDFSRPFRTGLADFTAIENIASPDQQPLLNEQFGFQAQLVVKGLSEEIDLSITPKVYVSFFTHSSPWGYAKWCDRSDAVLNVPLTCVSPEDLIYRSTSENTAAFVDPQLLEKLTDTHRIVQYYFTIRYWNRGESPTSEGHTKGLEPYEWNMPNWYEGFKDPNAQNGAAFSAYTVLDYISPGRAWINEVNFSACTPAGAESTNQFVEVAFPSACSLKGWKLYKYERGGNSPKLMASFGSSLESSTVPAEKEGDPNAPDFSFIAVAPKNSSGLVGEDAPDGTWLVTQLSPTDSYGFMLMRPSGIIEQKIVVQGNTGSGIYSQSKIGTVVVTNLEDRTGLSWTLVGEDTNDVRRSVGVFQNAGQVYGDWVNSQVITPGRLNANQVIPENWYLPPTGNNVWLTIGVQGDDAWFIGPDGPALAATIIVPHGTTTNLTFRTSPWYTVGSLLRDGEEKASDVRPAGSHVDEDGRQFPEYTYEFMEEAKTTSKMFVKAGIDPKVIVRGDLDPDDPYTPAIMEWLKGGESNGEPFAGTEISTNCFYWGFDEGAYERRVPLSLKDRYWLDIDPTSDDWDLRGGMGELVRNWPYSSPYGAPRGKSGVESASVEDSATAMEIIRKPSDFAEGSAPWPVEVTNQLVSVTMMISNKVNAAFSYPPYRLQGLGGERSDDLYAGSDLPPGAANSWTSVTFKVEMALDRERVSENFWPMRMFVFNRESFGAPSSQHPFAARIEILDPNSPSSPANTYGWGLYPEARHLYKWKLNSRNYLQSPSVLKQADTWTKRWE